MTCHWPLVHFALIDNFVDQPNVASIQFAENEGAFLMGAIAGLMTESNKVGFLGGLGRRPPHLGVHRPTPRIVDVGTDQATQGPLVGTLGRPLNRRQRIHVAPQVRPRRVGLRRRQDLVALAVGAADAVSRSASGADAVAPAASCRRSSASRNRTRRACSRCRRRRWARRTSG